MTAPATVEIAPATTPLADETAVDSPANVVFFEAFGNGLLYSVNYERLVAPLHVGLRAGASYFSYRVARESASGNFTIASFPLVASYYVGRGHHRLELGLGGTILHVGVSRDSTGTSFAGAGTGLGVAVTAVVGYRYFPRARGITFGIGFTPLVRAEKGFLPWGGANVGYVF